jgi:hypothetical protein
VIASSKRLRDRWGCRKGPTSFSKARGSVAGEAESGACKWALSEFSSIDANLTAERRRHIELIWEVDRADTMHGEYELAGRARAFAIRSVSTSLPCADFRI